MILDLDDGQLHLNQNAGDIRLVLFLRVKDGGGRLPSVHNLEIADMSDEVSRFIQLDVVGGCRNAVVVGQEHVRFVLDGFPYALVDLSGKLKKRPYVLFQQSGSVTVIQLGKTFSRDYGYIGFVFGIVQVGGKAGYVVPETVQIFEIQFDGDSGLFGDLVQVLDVYDLVVDVVSADGLTGRQFALVCAVCQDEGVYANQIVA